MKLSTKAMGIAGALLWGGALLLTALANLMWPSYATEFLKSVGSIYPGFQASRTFADVLVGTGYGLVDGGLAGLVFAWVYNWIAGRSD